MILYLQIADDEHDKSQAYHCTVCGVLIARATAAVRINGAHKHSFVNPAGIQCNFYTFVTCTNVLEHHELYEEHSWFPGYGWRFLMCARCLHHLGWKYDAVHPDRHPESFFGVLINALKLAKVP